MANLISKTADPSPSADDIIYVVNNPGGTAGDRKVTLTSLANFMAGSSELNAAFASQAEIDAIPELVAADPTEVGLVTAGGTTTLTLTTEIARAADVNFLIALVNEYAQPKVDRLTSDYSHPQSNTTLAATGLDVAVEANETYEVNAYIWYASSAVANLKIGWTYPAGAGGRWQADAPGVVYNLPEFGWAWSDTPAYIGRGTGQSTFVEVRGIISIGASAGNLSFRAAQSTSDASTTRILTYSTLVLRRLS